MKVPHTLIESTLVPHTAFMKATARLDQCFRYSEGAIESSSITLVGDSRTGKSRCIKGLLRKYRNSRNSEGMHIPILFASTPAAPTKNLLAQEMLFQMGDEKFYTGDEIVKTARLRTLLRACGTRMIIIDEFQHFIDKGSNKIAYQVADWLKLLSDDTNVSLVVAGLSYCTKVLDYNEQLDGRALGTITLPRFDWMNDDLRDEFVSILGSFEESMRKHFDMPSFVSDDMAFRLYCASGGLIGYIARVLRLAVWNAIDAGQKTIGLDELHTAYENAVRQKDPDAISLNPFGPEFSTIPSDDVLDRVRKVGTRVDPPPPIRGARRRKAASEQAGE